jgi:hypothetical protein
MSAREDLEDVITEYANDYMRSEYLRTTRWPEVTAAIDVYEAICLEAHE